jgi:hypothetical protein
MGFDASYLSHVEAGRMHADRAFARKAEEELDVGGGAPPADSLVVEYDHAELSYDGAYFRASQRRVLLSTVIRDDDVGAGQRH